MSEPDEVAARVRRIFDAIEDQMRSKLAEIRAPGTRRPALGGEGRLG